MMVRALRGPPKEVNDPPPDQSLTSPPVPSNHPTSSQTPANVCSDEGTLEAFEILNIPDFENLTCDKMAFSMAMAQQISSEPDSIESMGSNSRQVSMQSMEFGETVMSTESLMSGLSLLPVMTSRDELKNLLRQVAAENSTLRETIAQNNLVFKHHTEKLVTWQESVTARQEHEKQKFEETRLFINEIKKENNELKNKLNADAKNNKESNKKEKKSENKKSDKNAENNAALYNLSEQLDNAEQTQVQLSQDLQRVTKEKLELQHQLSGQEVETEALKSENEELKIAGEQANEEKWELNAVNADLQQRLQNTVALSYMQAEGNQSLLQEEMGKMMHQLEEERKVTAKLSKNLELERRKVESLEQRAKSTGRRGSGENKQRRSSLLPEELQDCETRLAASMETYRQRCDNLGSSLASCQSKLEDGGGQYALPDLATEMNKLRKLLNEEKKKSLGETHRLAETNALFDQVYADYITALDILKQAHQDRRMKNQQQAVLENIQETSMKENVDNLTARLMQAEEGMRQGQQKSKQLQERLAQSYLDLEALPLLRAQVEVYQSDFNAEREARERIAGEKGDLMEQVQKLHKRLKIAEASGGVQPNKEAGQSTLNTGPDLRDRIHMLDRGAQGPQPGQEQWERNERLAPQPAGDLRERINMMDREGQQAQIPTTVNRRNFREPDEEEDAEIFNCPKCNKEFRNMQLLQRHVNDCLDRNF